MATRMDDAVTALDPIAYWRLGERSGTTALDESGSHPGTYRNGVKVGAAGVHSDDTAAAFDGENDYLEVPHSPAFALDSGTLQLWFNPDTATTTQTLFSKDADRFGTGGHLSGWLEDDQVIVRLQSEGESYTIKAGTVSAGSWTHLAFRWGEGGMALYLDGVLVGSDDYTGGLAGNSESLVFGASQRRSSELSTENLEDFFAGRIDQISIHDHALTAAEIAALAGAAPADGDTGEGPPPDTDPDTDPGTEPNTDPGTDPDPDVDPVPPATDDGSALRVGPGQSFRTLADAVAASQPGDTILLDAGVYESDYSTLRHPLTIKAVGGVAHL